MSWYKRNGPNANARCDKASIASLEKLILNIEIDRDEETVEGKEHADVDVGDLGGEC